MTKTIEELEQEIFELKFALKQEQDYSRREQERRDDEEEFQMNIHGYGGQD